MTMNFANAADAKEGGFTLIDDGAHVVVKVKIDPTNAHAGIWDRPKKSNPQARQLSVELEVIGGQWAGARFFDYWTTTDPEGKGVAQGESNIKAVLEYQGAGPQNPQGYIIQSYGALDGMYVPVKVGVEPAEPYKDQRTGEQKPGMPKNRAKLYISPVSSERRHQEAMAEVLAAYNGNLPRAGQPQASAPAYQPQQPMHYPQPTQQQEPPAHVTAPQGLGMPQPQQPYQPGPQQGALPGVQHTAPLPHMQQGGQGFPNGQGTGFPQGGQQ